MSRLQSHSVGFLSIPLGKLGGGGGGTSVRARLRRTSRSAPLKAVGVHDDGSYRQHPFAL